MKMIFKDLKWTQLLVIIVVQLFGVISCSFLFGFYPGETVDYKFLFFISFSSLLISTILTNLFYQKSINTYNTKYKHIFNQYSESQEKVNRFKTIFVDLEGHASGIREQILTATASMEELVATMNQAKENSNVAMSISQLSKKNAEHGEKEVDKLTVAINLLDRYSAKIKEIVEVIDDIAFQTNLLAMNASVEAARAGENGKGFSVVANSVRSLSEKCADAARDIDELVQNNIEQVHESINGVTNTSKFLHDIFQSVINIDKLNSEIHNASSDQSIAIGDINKLLFQLEKFVNNSQIEYRQISNFQNEIQNELDEIKLFLNKGIALNAYQDKDEALVKKLGIAG